MPAPKAVLRDIHDMKLDPQKAHRSFRTSGRLGTDVPQGVKRRTKSESVEPAAVELSVSVQAPVTETTPSESTPVEVIAEKPVVDPVESVLEIKPETDITEEPKKVVPVPQGKKQKKEKVEDPSIS